MDIKVAIIKLAENERSLLIVNSDGEILDIVGLVSPPTAELLSEIAEKNKNSGFRYFKKTNLTETELREIIKSIVDALEWAKKNNPRPGANIPKG